MATPDWWAQAQQPYTSDVATSDIGANTVTVAKLAAAVTSYIPGNAAILVSSKSSNNEWFINVQLQDVAGANYTRRMPVRVYLGGTGDAGSAVGGSTTLDTFLVASSADSSGGMPAYGNAGVAASTFTALVDLGFITSSSGMLTLRGGLSTSLGSTMIVHVVWAGGCYRSSDAIGSTTVAT
jgi:hypothetical protein